MPARVQVHGESRPEKQHLQPQSSPDGTPDREEATRPRILGFRHVDEEMPLVLRLAILCTAKLPRDRSSMRDVLSMLREAKPRRKSGSNEGGNGSTNKDRPVFSTSPVNVLLLHVYGIDSSSRPRL